MTETETISPPRADGAPTLVVGIIGSGRAGTSLARGFEAAGYSVQIMARIRGGGETPPLTSPRTAEGGSPAELIFLTGPDHPLGPVPAHLSRPPGPGAGRF